MMVPVLIVRSKWLIELWKCLKTGFCGSVALVIDIGEEGREVK